MADSLHLTPGEVQHVQCHYPPDGFSDIRDSRNYWLDAVRDFWAEMDMDTDSCELQWIVNWFDERRRRLQLESNQLQQLTLTQAIGLPPITRESNTNDKPQ